MRRNEEPTPPKVTTGDTLDALVQASQRQGGVPLRPAFVQKAGGGPGPLAEFVQTGDLRALRLYLLLLTKASSSPWNSALPAAVWARALGLQEAERRSAKSAISKTWLRLEKRQLVSRGRRQRLADVSLLREDGSGDPYTRPDGTTERYLQVPLALFRSGPPGDGRRWLEVLTLPELAVLLIALNQKNDFYLPTEHAPRWYGLSADTMARGLAGLREHDLLNMRQVPKKAPLSPLGYTLERRYTVARSFRSVRRPPAPSATGRRSGSSRRANRAATKKRLTAG